MGAKMRCLLGADRSVSGSCERLPGGRIGSVAVEQSTERGGGFGQLCTPKRTGSFGPLSTGSAAATKDGFGSNAARRSTRQNLCARVLAVGGENVPGEIKRAAD